MRIRIYPGQYYDGETGLHYNYYRYYHPGIGRYVTPDTIGLVEGVNLYYYCINNPINLFDPDGLTPRIPWIMIARLVCSNYCFIKSIICHLDCTENGSDTPCNGEKPKKCTQCNLDHMKCMDTCMPQWRYYYIPKPKPSGGESGGGGAGSDF